MVSEEFRKNVESGDVVTIRSALVDYLIIDTTFSQFDEALDYAEKSVNVIEPDDGKADYDCVQEHWNETYLNRQKVALMVNFSQKRIDHIKLVVKAVLTEETHGLQSTDATAESLKVKIQGNRTGRTVLSEEAIPRPEQCTKSGSNAGTKSSQSVKRSDTKSNYSAQRTSDSSGDSRTGRRIIEEKSSSVKRTEEEIHSVDIAAWMIGGGIAVAAVGGLTAGIGYCVAEPAVIHTGAVIAGVGGVAAISGVVIKESGVVIKKSDGVITIVKER